MAKWTLPFLCLVGIVLLLLPEFFAPAQRNNSPQFFGAPPVDWRLLSMDKNNDEQVTMAEAQSVRPELTVDDFKVRDINGDGVWTSDDRRWALRTLAGRRRLEEIDTSMDGKITMEEYLQACQEEFKVLDSDADGGIVAEEWPRRFYPGGPGMAGVRTWETPPQGFQEGQPPSLPPTPAVPAESGFPNLSTADRGGGSPAAAR